ncbi:MAG: HAD-IC family P-type ATPase [Polyangiaceae bacterium]|jgi:cation transport ATPase|nr:HAD-IC family P-type ATPase [Polyangiaceae bacterium]
MTEHEQQTREHAGPVVPSVPCPACARPVDPLRAGHVAIFQGRFRYFCGLACRQQYVGQHVKQLSVPLDARQAEGAPPDSSPLQPLRTDDAGDCANPSEPDADPDEAAGTRLDAIAGPEASRPNTRSDTGTLLLLSATVAGVLAVALALIGTSPHVLTVRLVVACVGAALLTTRSIVLPRDPSDPHPAAVLGPGVIAGAVAVWARIAGHAVADEAAVLTGLVVVSTGTSVQLLEQVRRDPAASVAAVRETLETLARRVVPSGYAIVPAASLRPGEEVLIDAGEMVPNDVLISAGEATVLPWMGAKSATLKRPGDALVAGARIISGRVRATVTWTGLDRAWLRTTADPSRAAHVLAPAARMGRQVVEQWALASAALAGMAAFVNNTDTPHVVLSALAAHAAIASVATASTPSVHVLRGLVAALRRGVAYNGPVAWERAAHTTVMVFSARGTLLLGEPQVAEIVGLANADTERLLALAAGAEVAADDPIAAALHRAARARGVQIDAVRSPHVVPGLGVTAVTSAGKSLCVGSRALMLREHISMASVESKLAELEALGRTVLLVGVGGRLIGFIAMQDGLRSGARAAVQYLLDSQVEPVLMSGDARETCEAVARSLDIEHVRPEVLPTDRASEIRRIAESGATVAVVGRPAHDDSMLGAADVAVALSAAGSTLGEWSVTLASDDVRDAAWSVVTARRTRSHARASVMISLAPGVAGALAIAFGLLPPAYAPLAVLLGSIASHLHVRAVDSPEPQQARAA